MAGKVLQARFKPANLNYRKINNEYKSFSFFRTRLKGVGLNLSSTGNNIFEVRKLISASQIKNKENVDLDSLN